MLRGSFGKAVNPSSHDLIFAAVAVARIAWDEVRATPILATELLLENAKCTNAWFIKALELPMEKKR